MTEREKRLAAIDIHAARFKWTTWTDTAWLISELRTAEAALAEERRKVEHLRAWAETVKHEPQCLSLITEFSFKPKPKSAGMKCNCVKSKMGDV